MKVVSPIALLSVLLLGLGVAQAEIQWRERPDSTDLTMFAKQADGWFAYEVEAKADLRSMCCWQGGVRSAKSTQTACTLDDRRYSSYGSHSDFPLTRTLTVFTKAEDGELQDMFVVGEHCSVAGSETVDWLGPRTAQQSIHWLGPLATSTHIPVSDQALAAIAWHRGQVATAWLSDAVLDSNQTLAEQAAFWLGNERGATGLASLRRLNATLPVGKVRRHLTFAISQNEADGVEELLVDIGSTDHDREQREQAWFWLAQQFPRRAAGEILLRLEQESTQNEAEQLVFALSQLPDEMATKALLQVARSKLPNATRRHALFWLAQSDDDKAIEALTQMIEAR